jgi:hypothetical protein
MAEPTELELAIAREIHIAENCHGTRSGDYRHIADGRIVHHVFNAALAAARAEGYAAGAKAEREDVVARAKAYERIWLAAHHCRSDAVQAVEDLRTDIESGDHVGAASKEASDV